MLLGTCYYPEQRNPGLWRGDMEMMAEAGLNCVRVGEFAWKCFEPEEGKFNFSWMLDFASQAGEYGIDLLMCTPLRSVPAWLFARNPDMAIETDDGIKLEFGSRYLYCINHPVLLEKGGILAEKMSEAFSGIPNVTGWHLGNEHGDEKDCHCPVCRDAFRKWCREKYGNIAALNQAWGLIFWGLEFSGFDQIPTPRQTGTFHAPAHLLAWREFRSDSTINAVKMQALAVRKFAKPDQFITTNFAGNTRTDYFKLAGELDVCGVNFYPRYNHPFASWPLARIRAYRPGNFQVHELRNGPHMLPGAEGNTPAPGQVENLALHCVGEGADGVFFFRWNACPYGCEQSHGSIIGYDDQPTRLYGEVKTLFNRLKNLAPLLEDTEVVSSCGVFADFPTHWITGGGVPWNGPDRLAERVFIRNYESLKSFSVNVDAIGRESDFSRYKLIVIPLLTGIGDALAKKLVAYVENGGKLVWHPLCGNKDVETQIYPERIHPVLHKLFGLDLREFGAAGKDEEISFKWSGNSYSGELFYDLPVILGNGKMEGSFISGPYPAKPAVIKINYGKGTAYYLSTFPLENFYQDFYGQILDELKIVPVIPGLPEEIEVNTRAKADGTSLVFLQNMTDETVGANLAGEFVDCYQGCRVGPGKISFAPFESKILQKRAES